MNVDLQARRYEAVRVWRSGLCSASNAYRQWEAGSRDTHAPNVVGDEWFEGLRPHLPTTGRQRSSVPLTKSVAITQLSWCFRLRLAVSRRNGWWRRAAGHQSTGDDCEDSRLVAHPAGAAPTSCPHSVTLNFCSKSASDQRSAKLPARGRLHRRATRSPPRRAPRYGGRHEISGRRRNRTGQPDRVGHLAVRLA